MPWRVGQCLTVRPGSVLVGGDTQRLAAYALGWADAVQLSLKGKAEPYSAVQVLGVSATPSRPVEAALAGSGGVIFLTGEPVIGETRQVNPH